MQDYSIQRCTKRCKRTNRLLKPGESYYAVVELRKLNTIRYDIAASEWVGPPENAIAWWKSRMPERKAMKQIPTPNSELVEYLSQYCDDPQQQTLAYLLAMLLIRRKVLELANENAIDSQERLGIPTEEGLTVRTVSDGREFLVFEPDANIDSKELDRCQSALHELLVTDSTHYAAESENDATSELVLDRSREDEFNLSTEQQISLDNSAQYETDSERDAA